MILLYNKVCEVLEFRVQENKLIQIMHFYTTKVSKQHSDLISDV